MWMGEVQVGSMNCDGYFLRKSEIGKQSPTGFNSFVAGTPEVKRGCSRMVRLNVSFPLKLSVSEGLCFMEGFVRGDPGGNGCRRSVLKEGPEVGISPLQ